MGSKVYDEDRHDELLGQSEPKFELTAKQKLRFGMLITLLESKKEERIFLGSWGENYDIKDISPMLSEENMLKVDDALERISNDEMEACEFDLEVSSVDMTIEQIVWLRDQISQDPIGLACLTPIFMDQGLTATIDIDIYGDLSYGVTLSPTMIDAYGVLRCYEAITKFLDIDINVAKLLFETANYLGEDHDLDATVLVSSVIETTKHFMQTGEIVEILEEV